MANIATLLASLSLDSSNFTKGLEDAQGATDKLSGNLNKMTAVGVVGATAAVAGLGAGLVSSISVASTFEHQMDAVGAVSGASEDQLKRLSDTALRLGEDTAFGATEAAGAMEVLASSGMSAEQIINGAADATTALAAAGGTDLATAAGVASTAMGVWGIEAEGLTDVVNRVAGAANVSKFGVEDMAGAMAQGGGAAAAAGVDFADFSTTIGATAKYFSSGSDAGTSFKTFLQRLGAPTDKAREAMEALGISAFDSQGNMKSMSEISGILQSSLGGLSEEQRSAALATIFGSDASRTAIGLMELGSEAFTEMSDVMKNTDAAAVAAQRMGNFKGAMDQVMGSIETLQIKIGTALLPVLTTLAQHLATAIPAAAAAVSAGFAALMEATEPIRAKLMELGKTIASEIMPHLETFAAWFMGNGEAIRAAGAGIAAIFLVIAANVAVFAAGVLVAAAPIVALIAAIALLGAGVYLLIKHWDDITRAFPAAGVALDMVKQGFANVLSWITGTFVPGIRELAAAFSEAFSRAAGFVRSHSEEIQTVFSGVLMYMVTQAGNILTMLGGIIQGALQVITGIIKVFTGLLSGDWQKAWEGIKDIAQGVWTAISALVQYQIDTIKNIVQNLGPALVAIMTMAWGLVKNIVQAAWDGIKAGVSAGVAALPGLISAGAGMLSSAATTAWNGIKAGAEAVWGGIKSWVSGLPGEAASLIQAGAGLLLAAGQWILENFWNGTKIIWSSALAWFGTLPGLAGDLLQAGVSLLLAAGTALLEGLWKGAKEVWMTMIGWLGELPGKIVAALGNMGELLVSVGKDIIQGLINGMDSMKDAAIGKVQDIGGGIKDGVTGFFSVRSPSKVMYDIGEDVMQGLIDGIEAKGDLAEGAAQEFAGDLIAIFETIGEKGSVSMDQVTDALLEFGYDAPSVITNTSKIELAFADLWASVADGTITFEDAITGAIQAVDDITARSAVMSNAVQGAFADLKNGSGVMGAAFATMHSQLLDAGYGVDHIKNALGYAMPLIDEWFRAAAAGSMSWNEAIAGAMGDVQASLDGTMFTAQEWATKFAETPKAAAEAFNQLPDDLRFALGDAIEQLGGFGRASAQMFEDYSFATDKIGGVTEALSTSIAASFDVMTARGEFMGSDFEAIYTQIANAARDAGYDVNSSGTSMGAVMKELSFQMTLVASGSITMEQAIAAAMASVDDILGGSQMTAEQWATAFAENPRAAAAEFNLLSDEVRFYLGELLNDMEGWGLAAGSVFEDFSVDIKTVPLTFEQTGTEARDILGKWGGMFAGEIKTGGRLTTKEIDTLLGDMEGLITSSTMTEDAKAKALAMATGMATMLEQNKGTVTYQVQDMLGRLLGMLTDPNLVAVAETSGEAIGAAFKQFLIDMGLDGLPEELQAALIAALTTATAGAMPAATSGGQQVGGALMGGVATGTAATAPATASAWWNDTQGVINSIKVQGVAASNTAGVAIGTSLGTGVSAGIATTTHSIVVPSLGANIQTLEDSAVPTARTSGEAIGTSMGEGIKDSVQTSMAETTDIVVDAWETMDGSMRLYVSDMNILLDTVGAKMEQLGTIAGSGQIWDPLLGALRDKVESDAFLWQGTTGNSPISNIGELLGLAPGHHTSYGPNGEVINGESGFLLGGRGGQHSANKVIGSGEVNSVVANGFKWDGRQIVKMDDAEASTRFISGWNSTLDPSKILGDLKGGIESIAADGAVSTAELKKFLETQTVKAAGLLSTSAGGDVADKWMRALLDVQKGNISAIEKFIAENVRGDGEEWHAILDQMKALKNPPPPPPPPPVVLPEELTNAVVGMADVRAAREAGLESLADSIMRALSGRVEMTDIFAARKLGLEEIADWMAKIAAGVAFQEGNLSDEDLAQLGVRSEDIASALMQAGIGAADPSDYYDEASESGDTFVIQFPSGGFITDLDGLAAALETARERRGDG